MSQQPPLPPEIGTGTTPQSQPSQTDYVEIEVPITTSTPTPPTTNNNCLWGCGGMIGLSLILVGLLAGTLYLGVNSVFSNFTSFFNLPPITVDLGGYTQAPEVPPNVYVPSIERIQTLAQLTTTNYNYADVQTGAVEMPQWLSILYGDSAIMVLVGTIEAGVDISEITENNIVYDETNRTLTVSLPAPELQSCFLDENQSYVVSRDIGFFADPMNNLEDELRQRALIHYRDTALEEGILLDAENDARVALSELLSILVNDETVTVNIQFLPPDPNDTLPSSCTN